MRIERKKRRKAKVLDEEFEAKYKKLNNYCNSLIKKAVRAAAGQYITVDT